MKDFGTTENKNVELWCGYKDALPTVIDIHSESHKRDLIEREGKLFVREICFENNLWRETEIKKV